MFIKYKSITFVPIKFLTIVLSLLAIHFNFLNAQDEPCQDIPIGSSSECPVVISICPGEYAFMHANTVGGILAPPLPTGYSPCENGPYQYFLEENNDTIESNPLGFFAITPATSNLYTLHWNTPEGSGTGYFQVIAEDCGLSTDVGLLSLQTPNPTYSLHEGLEDIRVQIKNHQNATLFNTDIHWSVNGTEQAVFTYDGAIPHDSLDYQAIKIVTIGEYFFEPDTPYELKFWTSSPNGLIDTNPSNDSLTVNFNAFTEKININLQKLVSPTHPITSGEDSIAIQFINFGNTIVDELEVAWSINGVTQTPVLIENLNLAVSSSTTLSLGTIDLDTQQNYNIEFSLASANGISNGLNSNTLQFDYYAADSLEYQADLVHYICLGDSANIQYIHSLQLSGPGGPGGPQGPLQLHNPVWTPTNYLHIPNPDYSIAYAYPNTSTMYTLTGVVFQYEPCYTGPGGIPIPISQTHYVVVDDYENFEHSDIGVSDFYTAQGWEYGPTSLSVDVKNFGWDNVYDLELAWSVNGEIQSKENYSFKYDYQNAAPILKNKTRRLSLGDFDIDVSTDYEIKIWTKKPNNRNDIDSSNDTLTLFFPAIPLDEPMSGHYTIGSNGDYSSITAAANALSERGVTDGVTFDIETGVYEELVVLENIPDSSCDLPIVFQSATGNAADVVITPNLGPVYYAPLVVENVDGLQFKNLTIESDKQGMAVNVSNCIEIEGVIFNMNSESSYYDACSFNQTHQVVFSSNAINDGSTGLNIYNCTSVLIEDNEFFNQKNNAIKVHDSELNIYNNSIDEAGCGIVLDGCQANIAYNSIYTKFHSSTIGIHAENGEVYTNNWENNTTLLHHLGIEKPIITIHDNVLVGGHHLLDLKQVWGSVYNNNLSKVVGSYGGINPEPNCLLFVYTLQDKPLEMSIRNNNFYNDYFTAVQIQLNSLDNNDNWSNLDLDYNNYYVQHTNHHLIVFNTTSYDSLEDWQNALGKDSHSVSLDPEYTDVLTDLHINNTALFEIGDPSQEGTLDIDGDLRDATPSIGADHKSGQVLNAPSNPIFDPNDPIVLDPNNGNEEPVIQANPDFGWGLGGTIDPGNDDGKGSSKYEVLNLGGRPAPDANDSDETGEAEETPKGIDGVTFKWEETFELQVYPNPSSNGLVYLTVPVATTEQRINVYDLQARLLYTKVIDPNEVNRRISLDMSDQVNGTYIIECISQTHKTSQRLVIQH